MPELIIQSTIAVEPSHVSHGGGGSNPGSCESPASVAGESAQTSAQTISKRLIGLSPVSVVEGRSGFSARTVEFNTDPTQDLDRFRRLADLRDFDSLVQLCRERLLSARDPLTSLRWTKDRAIVEALRENFTGAYDLLASAHFMATGVSGVLRGKFENEFGIVLARLGRTSLALEHFGRAYQIHRKAENPRGCALSDHNRARALVTRGEHAKASRYIERALSYARATNDFRLEREVCDSLIEFSDDSRTRLARMRGQG